MHLCHVEKQSDSRNWKRGIWHLQLKSLYQKCFNIVSISTSEYLGWTSIIWTFCIAHCHAKFKRESASACVPAVSSFAYCLLCRVCVLRCVYALPCFSVRVCSQCRYLQGFVNMCIYACLSVLCGSVFAVFLCGEWILSVCVFLCLYIHARHSLKLVYMHLCACACAIVCMWMGKGVGVDMCVWECLPLYFSFLICRILDILKI